MDFQSKSSIGPHSFSRLKVLHDILIEEKKTIRSWYSHAENELQIFSVYIHVMKICETVKIEPCFIIGEKY